jgi:hypothetical protein
MPAVDAAAVAIGVVAGILNHGDPHDPRARKDDGYINIKCRTRGEQYPITP